MTEPALQRFARDIRLLAPVSDAALAELAPQVHAREVPAQAWLLQAGQRAEWCFYVVEGLLRECYIDAQGQEHTRAFADAGHFSGSLLDLLSQQPSVTWIQALEPSRLLAFRYRAFDALCTRWPELNLLARRAAEQLYVRKALREHQLLALPAAARYAQWCSQHPQLVPRIGQRILASYLGMTPEHLSRVRRGQQPAPAAAARGGSRPAA